MNNWVILVSCLFYVFKDFPVKYYLDFRLQSFDQHILHPKQAVLIPYGIFHCWVLILHSCGVYFSYFIWTEQSYIEMPFFKLSFREIFLSFREIDKKIRIKIGDLWDMQIYIHKTSIIGMVDMRIILFFLWNCLS